MSVLNEPKQKFEDTFSAEQVVMDTYFPEKKSGFIKYQHVERLGTQETEGLLDGTVYVFYKLDGTNASLWTEGGGLIRGASRNRELTLDNDNAGFLNWAAEQENLVPFFMKHPSLYLYGEWLVPHSLKTYRDDAWKRFYVFDVLDDTRTNEMLSYEAYKPLLEEFGIDFIPPMAIIKNPREEDLVKLMDWTGQFLVKDGMGMGEGYVCKNYEYINKYGRQTWGKVVSNEFKILNHLEMGAPLINGTELVEEQIVTKYCTDEFIKKEQQKIIWSKEPDFIPDESKFREIQWQNKWIPELLGRIWHEFIREETVNFVKEFKQPKVNFRLLNQLVIKRTKEVIGV